MGCWLGHGGVPNASQYEEGATASSLTTYNAAAAPNADSKKDAFTAVTQDAQTGRQGDAVSPVKAKRGIGTGWLQCTSTSEVR